MHSLFLPSKPRSVGAALAVAAVGVVVASPRIQALAMAQWPAWARDIAKARAAGDTGIGDTVVHLFGDTPLKPL